MLSHVEDLSPPSGSGPASRLAREEERERLIRAIDELPDPQRELMRWSLLEGLPHEVIAERLGIGADAARMRVARASAKLVSEFRKRHGGS